MVKKKRRLGYMVCNYKSYIKDKTRSLDVIIRIRNILNKKLNDCLIIIAYLDGKVLLTLSKHNCSVAIVIENLQGGNIELKILTYSFFYIDILLSHNIMCYYKSHPIKFIIFDYEKSPVRTESVKTTSRKLYKMIKEEKYIENAFILS